MARTFAQARTELMDELGRRGWQLSSRALKIPHASIHAGRNDFCRVWFKTQAVYYGHTTDFGSARSLWLPDIRHHSAAEIADRIDRDCVARSNPAIGSAALLWALGGVAIVGGIAYVVSRRSSATRTTATRQSLPATYYTGTAATGTGTRLPPPSSTTAPPTTDPRDAWYNDTISRLRVKLDQLHAWPADDQYWRAVFWLNGQHIASFRVPNNFPDNHMDRYDALRYVSDFVFAL